MKAHLLLFSTFLGACGVKETETPEPSSDSHDEPNDTGDSTVDTGTDPDTDTGGEDSAVSPDDIDDDGDGQTENEGDCNDGDPSIYTSAEETCDGIDNNCSGDESDAIDILLWYADQDTDLFGDPNTTVESCTQPDGFISDSGECDDSSDAVNPAAVETCDGVDNNCSGDEFDAVICRLAADSDGDGYGMRPRHLRTVPADWICRQHHDCNDLGHLPGRVPSTS